MEAGQIIIYSKEIQVISGRSLRFGQRVLQKIRKKLKKKKDHLVTINEFCNYCEIKQDEVLKALRKEE